MARYQSQVEVSWKAYVPMLQSARALLRHAGFGQLKTANLSDADTKKLVAKVSRGEMCPPVYCRESVVIFCAFAFEAYLNHLGQEEYPCWDRLDRLSWDAKLEVLSEKIGYTLDFGKRPFQTLQKLFKRRNQHAHGRSLQIKKTVDHDEPLPADYGFDLIEWGKLQQSDASTLLDDVESAIKLLNGARKKPDKFCLNMESSVVWATSVKEFPGTKPAKTKVIRKVTGGKPRK